jgi:hypothetical protein
MKHTTLPQLAALAVFRFKYEAHGETSALWCGYGTVTLQKSTLGYENIVPAFLRIVGFDLEIFMLVLWLKSIIFF